ncbi:hypothetical protein JMJ77_0014919 [Colletotrichum scovillei]|uniref:Uncharacterized protein n=1 Tax=Colletotrichum scovillei TaxID=1209932 RepID=A0A9P7QZJ5_9PEZI|nr:hypothetical protein JMJ77_0014919 [Colletotrichum scovillei]KAG7056564.1 hypothetical protein JMJ78_0000360 [Colletotrichum scovillei]KAG7066463.1 hypothetical protein JMJ76_0000323 [Colletotrichum scovillei]
MLLAKKSPLNPARKLRWKKIICAYFAITWVATPFLMVFIQLPRTDSRAMRDLMKGSTMTVVINHWMIFVALLILFFSKEKNNETEEGSETEVVRDEEIERGPEAFCRLPVNAEPSTSIDAVTEVDYNFNDHTEKATLLSEFIRDSSPTQIEPNEDSEGSGISVTPPKEAAADTLISLLDRNTQVSLSICLLGFLPGYFLMFLPICELLYNILERETASNDLQRYTMDILIFHGVLLVAFFGICIIIINKTRSLGCTGDAEIEDIEETEKKRRVLLRLGCKLAIVAFYLLVGKSSVWMQYLVVAAIARDPTGISHLLQIENLSLVYVLLPKLLIFAF